MTNRFQKVPVGSVTVGGEIGQRLAISADKILHHLDLEGKFARHFKQRRSEPEVPGGFVGYGMLMDGIVKAAARSIGGEELRHLKDERIAELIATQSADGAITAFADKIGFWDNHEQAYMIQAFVLDHRHAGNNAALTAALRLGDFLIKRQTGLNLGLETAFLMLYQESGDKRFLDYCVNQFKLCSNLDVYNRMLTVNGIAHVYTWIARVLAQLQYAQITGDDKDELFAGARELYTRVLHGGYTSITGSCSGGINWGEIWDNTQTGLGKWGETCVSAYLLRCSLTMLELDADSVYGDLCERVLYNAFFGAQSADGLRQRYFIPFNEAGQWYENETYCCPNNLRRMMFELPDAFFFQTTDGYAVNFYGDATLNLPNVHIAQRGNYPEDDCITMSITANRDMTLQLRIPAWCRQAEICLDDESFSAPGGGWFSLRRRWSGTHQLRLSMPMTPRLVRGTMAQQGRAALMRGPLVYGVELERNQLNGHAMDLLAINGHPEYLADSGLIRVPCMIPNQSYREFDVLFSRFASDKRARTFFPLTAPCSLVEDELFHNDQR